MRHSLLLLVVAGATVFYFFAAFSMFSPPHARHATTRAATAATTTVAALTRPATAMPTAAFVPEATRTVSVPTSFTVIPAVANRLATGPEQSSPAHGPMHEISCPIFSGPGYDKKNPAHRSHTIVVPELEAPFHSPIRSPPRPLLQTISLSDVRLRGGSAFERAFDVNRIFLRSVDVDALLLTWRLAAGLQWPKGNMRLMGWEHTGSELRGHFLGHFLSAAAMSYAATADVALGERLDYVLRALAGCAAAHKSGYLSAFPPSFLDRLEDITPVWAPYYTLQCASPHASPLPSAPHSMLLAGLACLLTCLLTCVLADFRAYSRAYSRAYLLAWQQIARRSAARRATRGPIHASCGRHCPRAGHWTGRLY